jgi:alkylated DNA repair dioxygenase AlkB
MLRLFEIDEPSNPIDEIPGLNYIPNYITREEHDVLLKKIDSYIWLPDLKRRVQHYGFKYDYKKRKVDINMSIGNLPDWADYLGLKMYESKLIHFIPDQVIVNEYLPGQGIANHIDCEPCFEDTIISLSLGSSCVMNFTSIKNLETVIPVKLDPCSLVILTNQSRYEWMHGIKAVKSDTFHGNKLERKRRVSLTFRKVILS